MNNDDKAEEGETMDSNNQNSSRPIEEGTNLSPSGNDELSVNIDSEAAEIESEKVEIGKVVKMTSVNHNPPGFIDSVNKYDKQEKQAGAELGQAQSNLV